MSLTPFESNLFRLGFLEGSFYQLYNEFPKISEGETFFSLKSAMRELALIKLLSFLKLRDSLLQNLVDMKMEQVDECLKPFWEPIEKQKEGIRLLRNKYLAHMQEEKKPFEITIEGIVYETKIASSWNDITFYCGCALNYCKFVKANFQKDFENAREKYYKSIPFEAFLPRFDIDHVKDPDWELLDAINTSIHNLTQHKLKSEIPESQGWSFSYEV